MPAKPIRVGVISIVGIVIVVCLWWWYCPATTVIVLRHAEKDTVSTQPDNLVPLTTAGQTRAATLADVAERAGVTRVFVTEKLRTQQTAAPLATMLGITPTQIAAADVDSLIDAVHEWRNRGRVIVIVGHSNTVPVIVDRLGGGAVIVADSQFDNLFVLTLRSLRTTRLIQATYGEPR
jgi:phosphohistidine phosphatase SixA